MDWGNYKFWRKDLRRLEKEEAEFYLLVQRAKQRIVIEQRIRNFVRLFERTSDSVKKFLGGGISLETLVIFDRIFSFREKFDKKLDDPVWETVSLKIKNIVHS